MADQQTTLTPRQKVAAEAVCRIRFTADGDGCECATASKCGCEEITLAVLAAADAELLNRLPMMRDANDTLWVELAALKGALS